MGASGGGNITAGSGTATPTVDAAGTYTLTVTNTDGCIDSDIATVSADITPPTAGSSAAGIIDCNNTTTTVTGTGGGTYSWVASGGGNITSGAGSATATVDAAGTYTVTVTGANGCADTDVTVVTDDLTTPTANAGSAGCYRL